MRYVQPARSRGLSASVRCSPPGHAGAGAAFRILLFLLAALFAQSLPCAAQRPLLLRISLENGPDHMQAVAVERFVAAARAGLGDRVHFALYKGGQLFRDRDLLQAMQDGKVEMAVLGIWQLDRIVPDFSLFLMPSFFGIDAAQALAVSEGPVGRALEGRLEEAADVKVLGRWLALGPAHVFFLGEAPESADMKGRRVRVPGSPGAELRVRELGGRPVYVAWSDLGSFVRAHGLDAMLTTPQSVASGRLWTLGVRSYWDAAQYHPQYVPMLSRRVWGRLSPEDRETLVRAWDDAVDQALREAPERERAVAQTLAENGVAAVGHLSEENAAVRQRLLREESWLASELSIDLNLLRLTRQTLGENKP